MPRPYSQEVTGGAQPAMGVLQNQSIITKATKPTSTDPGAVRPQVELSLAERMKLFNARKTHNYRIISRVETEVQTRWLEDMGQSIRVEISKRRASHIVRSIKGLKINDEGKEVPFPYAHCVELPFVTFDNPWVTDGFTATDVARALFTMPAFGNSFVMIPMTDEEVAAYNDAKVSPQVLEAQNRALDATFIEETLQMQQEMISVPSMNFEGHSFQMPSMPA